MWLVDIIKGEWSVLKAAPLAFFAVLIGGGAAGFTGGLAWRGQEVANLASQMGINNERLLLAHEKLSQKQETEMEGILQNQPKGTIRFVDPDPAAAGNQVKGVFQRSGWIVEDAETGEYLWSYSAAPPEGDAVRWSLVVPDDAQGKAIVAAFGAAGLKFSTYGSPAGSTPEIYSWTQEIDSKRAPYVPMGGLLKPDHEPE